MYQVNIIQKPILRKPFLKHHIIDEKDPVKYFLDVFDTRSDRCMFCKHDDGGWYHYGDKTNMLYVNLNMVNAPDPGIYIISEPGSLDVTEGYSPEYWWKRCFMRHPDTTAVFYIWKENGDYCRDFVLSAMTYIEYMGIGLAHCYVCGYTSDFQIADPVLVPFERVWNEVADKGWAEYDDEIKNPVRRLMSMSGMRLKEFSEYFEIKYRTVQNWYDGSSRVPDWAVPLFKLKLMTDHKI